MKRSQIKDGSSEKKLSTMVIDILEAHNQKYQTCDS